MSSEFVGEQTEHENEVYTTAVLDPVDRSSAAPETVDVGTEAPHTICIDQLCEAIDICHQRSYQEIAEDGEGGLVYADQSEKICTCIIDSMLDYAAREDIRNQLKKEMLEAMILAEFIDEFMIFFMEDLLEAIFFGAFPRGSLETDPDAEREMVPEITNDDVYLWMSYFYMQYCGYQLFLSTLATRAGTSITAKTEMAAIITDIVDEVVEESEYLQHDSDVPEKVCKNIIWGMLNTRRFYRRYVNMSESQILAGDIIDDIFEKVTAVQEEVVELGVVEHAPPIIQESTSGPDIVIQTCKEFMGIDKVANAFISKLISKSKARARVIVSKADRYIQAEHLEEVRQGVSIVEAFVFPSIEEFSVDVGIGAINDYIRTWYYSELWIFDVRFLMAQSDACSDFYFYEVVWCIPTVLYPVSQGTVTILFRIEVSRVKPPKCCVDVTYKFEGRGLVHAPFVYEFKEDWLFDILYSKLKLYAKLRF